MRAAMLLVLAGCLESPEGKPQIWPADGVKVVAAASINLDEDDNDEIVIAADGTFPGLFVFDDTDLDLGANRGTTMLATFTTYYPRAVPDNLGMLAIDGELFVASPGDDGGVLIEKLAGLALDHVAPSGAIDADHGAPQAPIWMARFGLPDGDRIALHSDDRILHVGAADPAIDNQEFPPTGVTNAWRDSRTATAYLEGTGTSSHPIAVVATDTGVLRSPMPPAMPAFPSWEPVRAGGVWLGSIAISLDGHDLVVGFDQTAGTICAVDVRATAPATPSCLAETVANVVQATLLFTPLDRGNARPDLVLLLDTMGQASVVFWAQPTFDGTTLSATFAGPGANIAPFPQHAVGVVVQHGNDRDIVVIGEDGIALCDPDSPICQP